MTRHFSQPAPPASQTLATVSGFKISVRPAVPGDEELVASFYAHVSPEDLRYRFLSAVKTVNSAQIREFTHGDHLYRETFLAFEEGKGTPVASATIAADELLDAAEIAISVHRDYKARGIAWTLVRHLAGFAHSLGIKTLRSIESRSNTSALALEREIGFRTLPFRDDATLMLVEADVEAILAVPSSQAA